MKTKLLYSLMFFYSISTFAQNILTDTISNSGKIIQKIIRESNTNISLEKLGCEKVIDGYNACVNEKDIDFLNNNLSNEEIETLNLSKNPSLRFVSFLLYANRNNNKILLKNRLQKILNEEFIMISDICKVEISNSLSSFGRLCFLLVNGDYGYFKPKYRITKKETKEMIASVEKYEKWEQITCP